MIEAVSNIIRKRTSNKIIIQFSSILIGTKASFSKPHLKAKHLFKIYGQEGKKGTWMLTVKRELTSGHGSGHTSYLLSHMPFLSSICPYLQTQSHLSLGLRDYSKRNSPSTNVNRIHFILACVMEHDKKPESSIPTISQLLSSFSWKEENRTCMPFLCCTHTWWNSTFTVHTFYYCKDCITENLLKYRSDKYQVVKRFI